MLPRLRRKEYYYDKFHRGFVYTCMGVTVAGGLALLYSGYLYFTQVIPEHKVLLRKREEELLDEGKDINDSVPA